MLVYVVRCCLNFSVHDANVASCCLSSCLRNKSVTKDEYAEYTSPEIISLLWKRLLRVNIWRGSPSPSIILSPSTTVVRDTCNFERLWQGSQRGEQRQVTGYSNNGYHSGSCLSTNHTCRLTIVEPGGKVRRI